MGRTSRSARGVLAPLLVRPRKDGPGGPALEFLHSLVAQAILSPVLRGLRPAKVHENNILGIFRELDRFFGPAGLAYFEHVRGRDKDFPETGWTEGPKEAGSKTRPNWVKIR